MGSLTSPPREYVSGGSRPTFTALDRARNELDAIKRKRFALACDLKEIVSRVSASVADRNRAYDQIDDLVADLFYDATVRARNEIVDIEDRLED